MAAGLNKVMIIGNVGRDPEMRYTPGGAAVTSFSVAVGRRWTTPENEVRDETEWFNVVAWDKLAETCNQLITKGRKVYIEGRLKTRSWEGQDGQKKYRTEVIAHTMQLLDSRPPGGAVGREEGSFPADDVEPDDIPF
ncbi:MAG: single-stranded DNA-binding protein [Chloroflexota bacterium]|nr:MAG: single-stranded DNA-binding protein [Chloroflexota bacterium]